MTRVEGDVADEHRGHLPDGTSGLGTLASIAQPARRLKLPALVATIFFCVSGGPFGLEPVMKSGVGLGLLLIVVTPIVWGAPAALMTAELASAIPAEGGYYVWVRQAMGPFCGFLCAWWSWVYTWFDAAIYAALFAAYIHSLIVQLGHFSPIESHPWIKWAVGLAVIVPFTWLNIRGAKWVGDASAAFMIPLLAPFLAMVCLGIPVLLRHPPHGFVAPGTSVGAALNAGLFVAMWNYLGWDSMSTVAGEVENPRRNFPAALAIGIPLVTLSYLLPAVVGVVAYPDLAKWEEGAWTNVAGAVGGPWLAVATTAAGIVGACGVFSATLLSASRVPFVLAEDGYLPKVLARLHPRFLTPVPAILLSALFYTVLSFDSFKQLTEMDVVLYTCGLVLEFGALVVLRLRMPELDRPYRIPGGLPIVCLVAVVPTAVVVFGVVNQFQQKGGTNAILCLTAIASGFVAYPLCARLRARRGPTQPSNGNAC